tara:strand:- start:5241 stop:5909 length:669 start_codon:yes stop_codon:yes gene_type:complete
MAGNSVVTAETVFAITSAELKTHLRIDGSDDDTYISSLVIAVHDWAKKYTQRSLTSQTLELYIDSIYDTDVDIKDGYYMGIDQDISRRSIILPQSPVASITHVKYFDDSDNESTFASSNYYLSNKSAPAKFVLRNGKSYPTGLRVSDALVIRYVAGYGNTSDVPMAIKQACLAYGAYLFEHRGDGSDNLTVPYQASQLLQPYVIRQFSTNPFKGTAHYGGMV